MLLAAPVIICIGTPSKKTMYQRNPEKETLCALLPRGTKAKLEKMRRSTGERSMSAVVTILIDQGFEKLSAS